MIVKNIDKVIQQTLKNRERALGRTSPSAGDPVDGLQKPLKIQDMASRTVFVRMISNRSTPVVIQGGQLSNETSVADGEAGEATTQYGVKTAFGYNNVYKKTDDGTIRYLSGIKDISVEYKGQYKAIRTANVNWTVGSLDDLDRLTPHFLTPGLTVLLDYGWVMKEPPSTFFNEGKIDEEAFKNPLPKIYENKGNYDAIAGTVSNFSFKLNEDGTFDCTTTITAMGINLFESMSTDKGANSQIKNADEELEINRDGLINSIINLPRIIIHDVFKLKYDESIEKVNYADSEFDALVDIGSFDAGLNLAGTYLSFASKYIIDAKINKKNDNLIIDEAQSAEGKNAALNHYTAYEPIEDGKFESDVIFAKSDYDSNVREDFFVSWGWFEDNIVSRYSTLYSDNESGELMNEFRSIDTITPTGSLETIKKSVKIRNNESLAFPQDAFKFILPGQHIKGSEILALPDFSVGSLAKDVKNLDTSFSSIGGFNTDEGAIIRHIDTLFTMNSVTKKFSVADNQEEGYLRNVMVNVKEIQKAFGIKNPDSISEDETIGRSYGPDFVEPVATIKEGMMNLAKALSTNYFDFWDFKIVPDTHSDNVKMIDSQQIASETKYVYTKFVENSHEVQNIGLYKFPTFQAGSIVKSQTLESKIIDAITITTMYGSNQDKEKKPKLDLTNQSPEVQLLFSQDKGEDYKDKYLNEIQKAYVKIIEKDTSAQNKIGNSSANPNQPITTDGSFLMDSYAPWWASWSAENKDMDFIDKIKELAIKFMDKMREKFNDTSESLKDWIGGLPDGFDVVIDIPYVGKEGEPEIDLRNVLTTVKDNGKKLIDGFKWDSPEIVAKKAVAKADALAKDIKNFKKGAPIYVMNGDADNGDQYELTLTDTYVPTIRERLYFTGENSDQFKTSYLHPIDLSLEIDGIGGILPGEIIQSDYMPKKYNQEIPNIGPFAFFQIFSLTHKVGIDGWSTEIGTKMRVNNLALKAVKWDYSKVDKRPEITKSPEGKVTAGVKGSEGDPNIDTFRVVVNPPVTTGDIKNAEADKKVEDETTQVIVGADTNTSNFGTNTTYRGTAAQNTIIYQLVPLWTPPEAGGAKDTSFYTEAPTGKIPIIIRQMFWDNYIEFPNGNGQSSVTSITGDMQASVDVSPGYAFPTAKSDLIGFSFNNNVRSKAGKYNTMSYIRSDGEKVSFKKGDTIYFPPLL